MTCHEYDVFFSQLLNTICLFMVFNLFSKFDFKTVLRFSYTVRQDDRSRGTITFESACPPDQWLVLLRSFQNCTNKYDLDKPHPRFLCFQGGAEIVSMSAIISINVSIISVSVPKKNPLINTFTL